MSNVVDALAIRNQAALELMRYKMLMQLAEQRIYPQLTAYDVNEILIVAGMPVITPDEVTAPELKVIVPEKPFDPLDFGEEDNPSDTF